MTLVGLAQPTFGFEAVLATDLVLGVAAEAGFDTAFEAVPFEDGLLDLSLDD